MTEAGRVQNLVFEGGGVRGIAYAGALSVLEEQGIFEGIRRVAGTSAGAFTALMVSLGYSSETIRQTLSELHFKTLEDKPNPIRMISHYGLYKGEVLYNWIVAQVVKAGFSETLTFAGLESSEGIDLRVYATDLNLRNTREFSFEKTPGASVAGAVRASMSIPFMYAAWQFPNNIPDDHIYVDGGVAYNYPFTAFDDTDSAKNTLGFRFRESPETEGSDFGFDNIFAFSKSLFSTILGAQTIDFQRDFMKREHTVIIDTLGYHATDLSLNEDGFEALYQAGRAATLKHFLTMNESHKNHTMGYGQSSTD